MTDDSQYVRSSMVAIYRDNGKGEAVFQGVVQREVYSTGLGLHLINNSSRPVSDCLQDNGKVVYYVFVGNTRYVIDEPSGVDLDRGAEDAVTIHRDNPVKIAHRQLWEIEEA